MRQSELTQAEGPPRLTAEVAMRLAMGEACEELFERSTRLGSTALRAPVCMVTVPMGEALAVVAEWGLPEPWSVTRRIPLALSFCRLVVERGHAVALEDAAAAGGVGATRLEGLPRGAFLGVPVVVEDRVVAVLSVLDTRARPWTADERLALQDLAASALRHLELLAQALPRHPRVRARTHAPRRSDPGAVEPPTGEEFRAPQRQPAWSSRTQLPDWLQFDAARPAAPAVPDVVPEAPAGTAPSTAMPPQPPTISAASPAESLAAGSTPPPQPPAVTRPPRSETDPPEADADEDAPPPTHGFRVRFEPSLPAWLDEADRTASARQVPERNGSHATSAPDTSSHEGTSSSAQPSSAAHETSPSEEKAAGATPVAGHDAPAQPAAEAEPPVTWEPKLPDWLEHAPTVEARQERDARRHEPSSGAVVKVDGEWRLTALSDEARSLLRIQRPTEGRTFWELFPGLVGSGLHREFQRVISERSTAELREYCRSVGAWLQIRAYPAANGGAVIHLRDEQAGAGPDEDELRSRERRYRKLFEDSRTALLLMDRDGRFVEVNRAVEALVGRSRRELLRMRLGDLAVEADAADEILLMLEAETTGVEAEMQVRRGDGQPITCAISAGPQQLEGATVYQCTLRDLTAQKQTEARLMQSALRDPLTGLPNRTVFVDRLERVFKHSRRRAGYRFAVLFLDLDNFKQVNDEHGHLVGDGLLVAVARRLESCVRDEDTVARIGGDEFAVLLDAVEDTAGVMLVVDRIREALAAPFVTDGRHGGTTVSIGVALSVSGYERADDLLRDADAAMYRAKSSGRDGYVIFDEDMHAKSLQQRQLEEDLRDALIHEELDLHYHPVVDLDGGWLAGMEALVRWPHPEHGILLPADFMPLAERSGLIVDIGWWVLRQACRQLRSWQTEYPQSAVQLTMSVNLSAKQFVHPELVPRLDEILRETGLDPQSLRLDLTESVVMQNPQVAPRLLQQLRSRGIHICIDDFGTGYSSLKQLREFPISMLKIDRSFISNLDESDDIVQTILALGRSMEIDAVAEGVETTEQLEQLRRLGTRFAQGFLFSLPLDTRSATALLKNTDKRG